MKRASLSPLNFFGSWRGRTLVCALILALLAVWSASWAGAAEAPAPHRYETAKREMDRLLADPTRSRRKDLWEQTAANFLDIYEKNSQWANRPAALYRAGEATEQVARRARSASYAQAAIDLYQRLVNAHPASVLADDALLRIARLRAEVLKDPTGGVQALERLIRDYPRGDMIAEAQRRLKPMKEAAAKQPPKSGEKPADKKGTPQSGEKTTQREEKRPPVKRERPARLQKIDWVTSKDRNQVTITLEFDREVAWSVTSHPANPKSGSPARLVVDAADTDPDRVVKPGMIVRGSILTRYLLDRTIPGNTRLIFDFSSIRLFHVSQARSPYRLIVKGTSKAPLKGGMEVGRFVQSKEPVSPANSTDTSLAAQLGLSVKVVMLDAGHGGSDPGTSHNGVVEREVTLDLARQVGAILEKKGLKVAYTRMDDTYLALPARTEKAQSAEADLMISIHVNAAKNNPEISGFETYYLDFASSEDSKRLAAVENATGKRNLGEMEKLMADIMLDTRSHESRNLAAIVHKSTLANLARNKYDTRNRGIKSAPFLVLMNAGMPGVLIEVGYCSNKLEARRLRSKSYRTALAAGIANGILSYAGKLAH